MSFEYYLKDVSLHVLALFPLHVEIAIVALAAQCGKVWLTVSSLWRPIAASDKVVDAELEVNWDLDCPSSTGYPDTIKVFTADPAHSNKFCLLLLNVVTLDTMINTINL